MAENKRRLFFYRNILSSTGFKLIAPLCAFISRTAFIYLLGIQYVGISGLFTDILNVLSLSELGLSSAITYALYKPLATQNTDKIAAIMTFFRKCYLIIGGIILIIGCILLPFIPDLISKDVTVQVNIYLIYFLYLLNTVISYWFFSYKTVLLTAAQQNYREQIVNIISSILNTIILIGILFLFHNFLFYLVVQILLGIIKNAYVAHIVDKIFPNICHQKGEKLSKKELNELWTNVYSCFVAKISGTVFTSTDSIIISKFISTIQVGVLSNYKTLILLATSVSGMFTGSMLPAIGEIVAIDTPQECEMRFRKYNFIQMWLTSVIAICLLPIFQPFISGWIGKSHMTSNIVMYVLVLNFWMDLILQMVYQFRAAYGLYPYGKYFQLVCSIINIPVSIWWGKMFGLFGVLFATSILNIVTFLYPYYLYKYGFQLKSLYYYRNLLLHALITILAAIFTVRICQFSIFNIWIEIIIKGIIAFTFSNFVFFICYRKKQEYTYMIHEVSSLFRKIVKKF